MLTAAVVTFFIVLLLVVGSYWGIVLRPEAQARSTLKRRLQTGSRKRVTVPGLSLLKAKERLSHVNALDWILLRAYLVSYPLAREIRRAGLNTSVAVVLLASGCMALAAAFLSLRYIPLIWLAPMLAVAFGAVPAWAVHQLALRRLRKFEEQFPEAIDLIARALRAGHAFTTGLSMVGDEAPEPVASEFRLLYEQQNFGMPLPDALREFAARVPLIDAQFFATAVLTQRESGGNLSEVLDNLGKVIRDRFRVKRQVRVLSAHGRLTGWILACLPPVLAIAFMTISPGHLKLLTNDPIGVRMIEGAIALQIIGTLIIRKLVRIEY